MKSYKILLLVNLILLSSCVTNRKYVYLQKDDVNVKDLPKDTVVRTYSLPDFEYRIQPQDMLMVIFESLTPEEFDIFNRTAGRGVGGQNLMNMQFMGELVDEEGCISYPVVGRVKVAGLTVFEAQDKMQKVAEQYLQSPIVKVRLVNFRFTVLGEVKTEGTVVLPNNRVNLMEAIGLAGGLTDMADKRNIKLIRQKDGRVEVRYINLLDEEFVSKPEYFIHQNDVLIVPALRQRPYQNYLGKNLSLTVSILSLLIVSLTFINTLR
ncbi:MAG: polysaccharide biosynthesis/export family protein [Cyclobacteriaceae bacterium]|nr:polysaccharide biosynthesis/export family protein [Cyclobacteriaceae bacterium]